MRSLIIFATVVAAPLLLMLLQENARRIAEWVATRLARQMPRRSERWEEEWHNQIDELPNGFTQLFYSLGFVRSVLVSQDEHWGWVLFDLIMGTVLLVLKTFVVAAIVSMPFTFVNDLLTGSATLASLPFMIFGVLFFLLFLTHTDRDFQWTPKFPWTPRALAAVVLPMVPLLVLAIVIGPQEQKSVAMFFLFGIAVIFSVFVFRISMEFRSLMRKNSSQ